MSILNSITNITAGKSEVELKELLESEIQQCKLRFKLVLLAIALCIYYTYEFIQTGQSFGFKQYSIISWPILHVLYTVVPWKLIKNGYIAQPSGWRILFGQILDTQALAMFLIMLDGPDSWATLLYAGFVMMMLGNGLRFGIPFLITSSTFAFIGFSFVFYYAETWNNAYTISGALLFNILISSLYTLGLVRRLNTVQQSLVESQKSRVKALEEAEKLKSKFFANISHEFRTPIAISMASLESLNEEISDANAQKKIEPALRNQRKLLQLVNEILDIEKMEQGKLNIKVQRFSSFANFLSRRVEQFNALANSKKIKLNSDIDENLKKVDFYGDAGFLDKMIYNLLSNAIKFTNTGSVSIIAKFIDQKVQLEIIDTGVGIKEEELPKIFDRFQQAHGSESKDYAGTGIGLSLVKEVVSYHKGEMNVTSTYGEGTQFKITLPTGKSHFEPSQMIDEVFDEDGSMNLVDVEEESEGLENVQGAESAKSWNAEQEQHLNANKSTLLFVDDNEDLRNFIKEHLVDTYNVFLGVNGEDGLALAKKHHPDAIISDQMMPKMSGTEFLRELLKDKELKETPFIILTANANPEQKMEALKEGATDFLYKPFHVREIIIRVDNLLTLSEQSRRIRSDLKAARSIQQAMLPNFSKQDKHFNLQAFYEPCEQLSGDFFDIFEYDEHLFYYLADVTSHGVASAQVTFLVRSLMKNVIKDVGHDEKLNLILKEFTKRFVRNKFDYGVALQLFRLDKISGEIEMVQSGSPPPIVFSDQAPVFMHPKAGPYIHPSLSVSTDQEAEIYNAQLKPGDIVFAYTDGVIELRTDTPLRDRRFSKLINEPVRKEAWDKEVLQKLCDIQSSNEFDDDLTMIRLNWLG